MLKESTLLTAAPNATNEQWRRFIGQQLMLLTELIVFCVPAFFTDNGATISPLGKRKATGAVRSDLSLHKQSFVPTRAKADTTVIRSSALQYEREARICDVQHNSADTSLFAQQAGLVLPLEPDEKTVLMLKESTLTPTGSLLSFCTDVIMQVQCAAVLGRLPSVSSVLVSTSQIEMSRFRTAHSCTAIEEDTPCVSVAQLWSGARLIADNAPPAVVQFVKAAANSGDTLLPYYGLYRLARCLCKPNEEISECTMNGVTSRFRTLFNGFRAQHFPATEPLYQVLDGLHKPYQVCMLNSDCLPYGKLSINCPRCLLFLCIRLKCAISRPRTRVSASHEALALSNDVCLQCKTELTLCCNGNQQLVR
jgi:hypothetical protein